MRIENLTLKGIGPFDDEFSVTFAELDEIVAITGPNGAGKTFLLECIPGAIYGYFPFRMYKQQGISIYDMARPGQQSHMDITFTIGDRRFRIERTIDIRGTWKGNDFHESSKNQTVLMMEWNGADWMMVAEKAKAVEEFVEREICPKQLFLASCFNSQNSAGDIVDCGPDERKQIFSRIIGLGDLQDKSEFFGSRAKHLDGLINQSDILVQAERGRIEDNEAIQNKKAQAESDIAFVESESSTIETALSGLMEQKARFEKIADDIQKIKSRIVSAGESLRAKQETRDRMKKMVAVKGAVQQKRDELLGLRDKVREYEVALEGFAGIVEENNALKVELQTIETERGKLLASATAELNRVQHDISAYENRLQKAGVEIQQWTARQDEAAILESLNCPADCRYVEKARAAKEWILQNPLEPLLKKQTEITLKINELGKYKSDVEESVQRKDYEKPLLPRIKEIEESMLALSEKLSEYQTLNNEIKVLKSRISMHESNEIEGKWAKIELAETELPGMEDEISELETNIEVLRGELNGLLIADMDNHTHKISELKRRREQLETKKQEAVRTITICEEKQRNNMKALLKIGMMEKRVEKVKKLKANYLRLADAFGRSGIQALVIDSEKSQFIDIARELFGILSGGRMALNFSTQRLLKSGDKKEDFDLILTVDGIQRKLEQCSQGQQDLGRIVMRATLGIYNSVKSGSRIQTYFLDETTGSLDEINRESYYDFLKYLLRYFQQIFVISHQDITRSIPCQIGITAEHGIIL